MRDMLLVDRVHALTFSKKMGRYVMDDNCRRVMQRHRADLKQAQRFVINDDSVRLISALSYEEQRLPGWSFLARLPYETCWFEYNLVPKMQSLNEEAKKRGNNYIEADPRDPDLPEKLGYLMHRDSQDPNSHRWICHMFSISKTGVTYPSIIALVFDPEGDGRFPVRGSASWSSTTLSLLDSFKFPVTIIDKQNSDPNLHYEIAPEMALIGLFEDRYKRTLSPTEGLDWLNGRLAVIISPWWEAHFAAEKVSHQRKNETILTEVREHAGHFRWIMTMLAAINGLPKDVKYREPHRAKHSVGMYQLPYFGTSTITLTIPTENRLVRSAKLLDRKARIDRHRRRHQVIGHWRVIEKGKAKFICRHMPTMVEHNVGMCERCELLVRWIPDHERGDATLGYVKHTYEVST